PDLEVEMFARERMIAVERYHVTRHPRHGQRLRARLGLRVKVHAGAHILDAAQRAARHALYQALVVLPVAFRGTDPDADLVAGVAARQLPLQARHDVAVAMEISEGLAGSRAVDDLARVVLQGVVNRHDAVLGDGHWKTPG